jgi:hypothetical protein
MYLASLIMVLTGVPIRHLEAMIQPKTGIRRKHNWLPTDGQILDWIEARGRQFAVTAGEPLAFGKEKFFDRNGKLIPGHKFEEPTSDEEKQMHHDRLKALSRNLRETARATQRANSKLAPTTVDQKYTKAQRDEMLVGSLEEMEKQRPDSMRGGDDC